MIEKLSQNDPNTLHLDAIDKINQIIDHLNPKSRSITCFMCGDEIGMMGSPWGIKTSQDQGGEHSWICVKCLIRRIGQEREKDGEV